MQNKTRRRFNPFPQFHTTDCNKCKYSKPLFHLQEDKWKIIPRTDGIYCTYTQYGLDNKPLSPIVSSNKLEENCSYYKEKKQ